jgi:hypothetical protein
MFALLMALCLLCCAIPVSAENGVTVSAGPYVFELPEGSRVTQQKSAGKNAYTFTAKGKEAGLGINYEVTGLVYQYAENEQDTQGVMDYQTFYLLAGMLFGQKSMGMMAPSTASAEMPDGQVLLSDAKTSGNDLLYIVSHYYDGVGYMLVIKAAYSGMALAVCMRLAEEVAVSGKPVAELAEGESLGTIVITNSSANVRSAPDGGAAKLITAVKGDTFPWLGEENGWYKIMVNGQIGYVSKSLSAVK